MHLEEKAYCDEWMHSEASIHLDENFEEHLDEHLDEYLDEHLDEYQD